MKASRFTGVNNRHKEELCPLAEPWFFSAFWTMLHVFCSFSWEWLVFGGKTSVLPQHLSTARGQTIQNWWQTEVSEVGFTWPVGPKQGRKDGDKQRCSDLCTQGRKNKRGRSTQMSGSLCNIRWHCWPMKLSMSSWLFDLIGLFLNCCVCHIQPFLLEIAMILIKSKRVWRLIQTASWLTGKAVTL